MVRSGYKPSYVLGIPFCNDLLSNLPRGGFPNFHVSMLKRLIIFGNNSILYRIRHIHYIFSKQQDKSFTLAAQVHLSVILAIETPSGHLTAMDNGPCIA